jgi:hypothetical protein
MHVINFWFIEAKARNRQAEFRREAAHERRSREAQAFEPRGSFLRQLFDLLGAAPPHRSASETRAPAAGSQLNDCVAC